MPRDCGGFGMDAQWSDDFHHALFTVLVNEELGGYYSDFGSLGQLAKALEETFVYDGILFRSPQSHHGRPVGNLSQHRFLGFIQNHDQVGNRAVGDRICESAGSIARRLRRPWCCSAPFIPMLFQGEEWAAIIAIPLFCRSRGSGTGAPGIGGTKARIRGLRLGSRGNPRSGEPRRPLSARS